MPKRYALGTLALLLALAVLPARAQHADAIDAVKAHFLQNQARYGASDLADLVVTDAYASRRSGATYVYLRQAHAGIPVVNADAQAALTAEGRVFAPHARFIAGLESRVNTTTPSLSAASAAAQAERHLRRTAPEWYRPAVIADAPGENEVPSDYFIVHDDARLVYFQTDEGVVRLAWEFMVEGRDGNHLWMVRADAVAGTVLDLADLVDRDTWSSPTAVHVPDFTPRAASQPALAATGAFGAEGSYNVFACESPNHCGQAMRANPNNADASPLGWHNDGSSSYTITRGNNVYASEDRNADNLPGFAPDGGAGLVFDFPFDPDLNPVDYQELAITNLFFWNNVFHDVMWHYGFDEAAGNFQNDNFGNGGIPTDYVRADAQDGSGRNNANFSTPPDGGAPRMQMFEWDGAAVTFEVLDPAPIAGSYPIAAAQFGASSYDLTEDVVVVIDADGNDIGCTEPFQNAAELVGKIALVQRGLCEFGTKSLNAEEAGAVGVLVYNCEVGAPDCSATSEDELVVMGPGVDGASVTIASAFVQRATGLAMLDHLPTPGVTAQMIAEGGTRDSDLDAGIIVHEYGHGVSNRLTGGPSNTSCLNNLEQPGEGWSDWYGLMMTQRPGDTAEQPRGVGTYVTFEGTDGIGIRSAPYSTDFAVNDFTYGDTRLFGAGQQHAVGHVWSTIFWEATWELINAHGFDPNVYDAEGTAGNQVMLQLVTEGMKLQPCSPGFVDTRDAVLAADTLLYGGEYSELLWRGFARRGLGVNAQQNSSNINADNIEDFTEPTPTAAEDPAAPAAYRLSRTYPNPFREQAAFTLEVAQAQAVRVGIYDALGRQVALLHDGDLAAGTAHRFAVDARTLASGTYFVRVSGEAFAATERLTLLK